MTVSNPSSTEGDLMQQPDRIRLQANGQFLFLLPLAAERIRVVSSLSPELSGTPSLILVDQPAFTEWTLQETAGQVRLLTASLDVRVERQSLQVQIFDRTGRLIFQEASGKPRELAVVDVVRTKTGHPENLKMEVTPDGLRIRAQELEPYVDRQALQARLHVDFAPDEALYGLGSHEDGIGNLRGTHQYLYQQNMKACVPVLISSKGYGLLFDCSSLMTFRDDFQGSYLWLETVEQLDYVFYAGDNLVALNRHYYALTGTPPLLPRWSFGYIQSKERYVDADELVAVTCRHREKKIPLDCIVLDWRSWEGDLWGEKKFDRSRFADPKAMVERLHAQKTRLMISIWPNMAPGGSNSDEMLARGFMLGNQSTYDAFNADARQLYWQQASEGLFSSGLDAWWCDCTEPFEGDWKGALKQEPEDRITLNCDEARRYLDPAQINAYSLVHSQGIYEGQRAETTAKRVLNLTRSSYAGQHRYATVTWSGDTAASWSMFKNQIPAATHFCVTGEPYWTYDIGAFFVRKKEQWFWSGEFESGYDDPDYREFYLRMLQCGAFLPMFRSHGTDFAREVWQFGQPGDVIYDTLVRFIRLRYRLLPYFYSLAGQITHHGQYWLAPLGMVFPQDAIARDIRQAYMVGPSVLVWPITDPLQNLAGARQSVYLPSGCDWYDFWTGRKYAGGQWQDCAVSLETIPVFVRAGSILPLAPEIEVAVSDCTDDLAWQQLDVQVYPGQDVSFDLYEDEGDNYQYEAGVCAWTRLIWDDATRQLTVQTSGGFPGFVADKEIHLHII